MKEVITAVVTPFTKKNEIDEDAFGKLLLNLQSSGTHGVVISGSTGEAATLSTEEKLKLFEIGGKFRKKNFKIIAGVGSNNTASVLELSKELKAFNLDSLLVVTPYYNKPPQEDLYEHFKVIADKSPFPIILYEVPSRTGVSLAVETALKLSQHKNIIGIKDSNPDLLRMFRIKSETKNFLVYSGDDGTYLPSLSLGSDGVISVLSHVIPKELVELGNAFEKGDFKKALSLQEKILKVSDKIFSITNPIGIKASLASQKRIENILRAPLRASDPKKFSL